MAKVSLRNYNHLIENLIENGQHDEAVAHCRHILQTFPKYIEAYRLLGKAYLESKRYNEAVDIFQRLLMSVPDDFVSHVGLSIIADDQGKLDDAIWHMERAFEVQPSNAAIQGELQRLFGRRDGVEPPKIRLTRGALAHMYVQGELYSQAISESRAVLANDSQRIDMQVLLAKAYFFMGQKTEATDTCSQLLKQYPYCLDANCILVEILSGTQRADSAQVYRQRVIELEPYSAFVQDSVFHADQVADAEVSLERLEYSGQPVEMGANWGGKMGIGLTGDATAISPASSKPDWLKQAAPPPAPAEEPAPAPAAAKEEEQLPDFLRQAGWAESSGPVQESEASAAGEAELAPAVQADLPDWVKAMAPAEAEAPAAAPSEPVPPVMEVPDWLQNLDKNQGAAAVPAVETPQAAPSSDGLPDWLQRLDRIQPSEPAPQAPQPKPVPEVKSAQPPAAQPPVPAMPAAAAGADPLGGLGKSAQEQDDAMAWLEGLAAKHGAKAEELVTDPNARTEVAPDWVDKAKTIGEAAEAKPAPAAGQPLPGADDQTGMWFRHLEASETETFVAQPGEQQAASAEPSDWLSGLSDQNAFSQISGEPAESAGEAPILGTQDTPDWLREAQQGAAEPPAGEVPDWLHRMEPPTTPAQPPAPAGSAEQVDLPAWLASLDQEESPAAPAAAPAGGELPSWLAEEKPVEAPAAEPTRPEEWHAAEPDSQAAVPTQPRERIKPAEPAVPAVSAAPGAPAAPVKPQTRQLNIAVEQPQPLKEPTPKAPKPMKATRKPEVEASLASAQAEMGRGNIGAAIDLYAKLIRKGKSLEEIIRDLREALYRYPVEVPLWQVLGDAYMRSNRLQDALDAYTKAEELLR